MEATGLKRKWWKQIPPSRETGALLNFGHTLGHAVEKLKDFTMLHGHCVGLGCIAAGYISHIRGMITEEEFLALRDVFTGFGLPGRVDGLDWEDVGRTAKSDKKMEAGVIKFILLKAIGHACVDKKRYQQ